MSRDTSPLQHIIHNVKADLDPGSLLITITITTGILLYGFALGVRYAATTTLNQLIELDAIPPLGFGPLLAPQYNSAMNLALGAATILLVVGVALDQYSGSATDEQTHGEEADA